MGIADGGRPFAALLRAHRTSAGLSQEELAERAGLSRRGISDLERGTRRTPYSETVRRLADALDLDELARAELQAAVRRALPTSTHPDPEADKAPKGPRLPMPLTSFVGRALEVQTVQRLLANTRLLTLVGAGGIGKTRLALEVAREVQPEYPDGAHLVELAPLADPALVTQAVASEFGVRDQIGRSLVEALVLALQDRRLLLMLDNCEHLVQACADLVYALLRRCAPLRVLATSREPLGLSGETRWSVPSLSLPASDNHLAASSSKPRKRCACLSRDHSPSARALATRSATCRWRARSADG